MVLFALIKYARSTRRLKRSGLKFKKPFEYVLREHFSLIAVVFTRVFVLSVDVLGRVHLVNGRMCASSGVTRG